MAVRRRRRTNSFPRKRRRTTRRGNPRLSGSLGFRSNPSGIGGIVIGGAWIGAGMYLGGIVNGVLGGVIGNLVGGLPFGNVIQGLASAYIVGMIGGRFTRNAGLMAAGAFAPTAVSLVSGVLGGVMGGIGSAVQTPKQSAAVGGAQSGSNVIQMPVQGQG